MPLNDRPADGQPQPAAANRVGVGSRGVGLIEPIEHAAEVLRRDAAASVRNRDDRVRAIVVGNHRHGDLPTVRGEPDRVVQQIATHLSELRRVAGQSDGCGRRVEHQADRPLLCHTAEHGDGLPGDGCQVDLLTGPFAGLVTRFSQQQQVVGEL